METKIPEEERTFETRLLFIKDIFENKYPNEIIMANCINYKLNMSYDSYLQQINRSISALKFEDPIKVLRRIDD